MKNPLDYTLGEIETLALLDRDSDALNRVDLLRTYIKDSQQMQRSYQVQAVAAVIREKPEPVQKRGISVDAALLNACVLVHEDLTSGEQQPNN